MYHERIIPKENVPVYNVNSYLSFLPYPCVSVTLSVDNNYQEDNEGLIKFGIFLFGRHQETYSATNYSFCIFFSN